MSMIRSRTTRGISTYDSVVTSPATTTSPVVTRHSTATRLLRILPQQFVEHRVADLVRDLVRMPLGHRFRGEESARHEIENLPARPLPPSAASQI